jgi:DNA-binding transcriptional ArsR family regulator
MRPIYHPSVDEMTVEGILYALSDPVRVCIMAQLADAECARNCAAFTNVTGAPMAASTLSQHFKILREAGLIRSERKGVELKNETRYDEIKEKFGAMIGAIVKAYEAQAKKG